LKTFPKNELNSSLDTKYTADAFRQISWLREVTIY
jgi:hypothetical protein